MNRPSHAPMRRQATRTRGWSDERFAHVADVALTVAGLVFPPNRQPSAESAMRRVMSALRIAGPEELLHAVARPGDARDALLAELTVGESYFFREAAALSVLERELVNGRRASEREDEPLRIWSAGCATGEEPYTLAMLLRELGWQHHVHILGTDISRPRLDAAKRGRYTQWSLRGVSQERINRWFQQRAKQFIVEDSIRAAVRFEQLNFISDDYPSAANGTSDQDLILCRNVLIYFDLPTVAQIATQLLRALRPNGWLLLGASDPPLADLVECRTLMSPSGVLYQRADAEPRVKAQHAVVSVPWIDEHVVPDWATPATSRDDPAVAALEHADLKAESPVAAPVIDLNALTAYSRGDYRTAAEYAEQTITLGADEVSLWIVWIRALANTGDLARAGEITAAAIDRHRLEPELHYLHGMLLLEGGSVSEGARAARRALYLDREFVIGYMLLGDALSRLGDIAGARRAFDNAVHQLAHAVDDALVPAGDGVHASRMRQIAIERLRGLTVRA
ncbi:MAG: CheR family methyltransferase [bacterium]